VEAVNEGKHCTCTAKHLYSFKKHIVCVCVCESTSSRENVLEIGIMLPDHSKVCLAVTTPCHLQPCAVLGNSTARYLDLVITV